jgi:hypothetical protein
MSRRFGEMMEMHRKESNFLPRKNMHEDVEEHFHSIRHLWQIPAN